MKRTAVNPWAWSVQVGYNQAEIIEGVTRQVTCSGQTAVDENGSPQHAGDMRKQITLALDNLEVVLKEAGMTLANVTRLGIYSTDMDQTMQHFDVIAQRFGELRATPPTTLLGINRLAFEPLMIEIEASAAD